MRQADANGVRPEGIRRVGVRVDLLLAIVLALVCGALTTENLHSPGLRIAAGVLLVLILPGYALSALVLPGGQLGKANRLLCTLGSSLSVAALGGLLLDTLPGHMSRSELALLLGIVTVGAAIGAMLRADPRATAETAEHEAVEVPTAGPRQWMRLAVELAFGVAAVLIAIAAVALARHAESKSPAFSELSSLPVTVGRSRALRIELRSKEHSPTTYMVTVREDGTISQSWHHILLRPGQRWQQLSRPARHRTQLMVVTASARGGSTPTLQTTFYPHPHRAIAAAGGRRRRVAAHRSHVGRQGTAQRRRVAAHPRHVRRGGAAHRGHRRHRRHVRARPRARRSR